MKLESLRARSRARPVAPTLGALLLLGLLLGGCASARFVPTGADHPPRAEGCPIEVFSSKLPDRDYEELGILEGEGSLGRDTLEDVLPKMREEACKAGGDAIILTGSQKFSDASDITEGDDKLSVTATVVRWVN